MTSYDAWLEEPYQRMARENDAYLAFCEDYDLDPDDSASHEEFDEWYGSREEEAAIERWEAAREDERLYGADDFLDDYN